jgi:hypothetical protein
MWMRCNVNPAHKDVPDCVIRAVAVALNLPWIQVSDELYDVARSEYSVTCDDHVWGKYLYMKGFIPFLLPETCPECITIEQFTRMYPKGIYIIGTGSHAVAVIDGDYYDSWDSGKEIPSFFWRIR